MGEQPRFSFGAVRSGILIAWAGVFVFLLAAGRMPQEGGAATRTPTPAVPTDTPAAPEPPTAGPSATLPGGGQAGTAPAITETVEPTATQSPSPTGGESPTGTGTETATLPDGGPAGTPSVNPTPTPETSLTLTLTPTPTSTPTVTATIPAPGSPDSVWISEVAWAGTAASSADEWIELWNGGGQAVDLTGWVLTDGGDLHITLGGTLAPGGFYLLERGDDNSILDLSADQIYSGALSNAGEALTLLDAAGAVADSIPAGVWPAGSAAGYLSMERAAFGPPSASRWCSNDSIHRNGSDAFGDPLNGTPRGPLAGSCGLPSGTPTPTLTLTPTVTPTLDASSSPTSAAPQAVILISEVAWAGTAASSADEWLELHNPGAEPLSLDGWVLTDGGDIQISLRGVIASGGYFLLERSDDATIADLSADQVYVGSLANSGEMLQLVDPAGGIVDTVPAMGGWPAGSAVPWPASMERMLPAAAWCTNDGVHRSGTDAIGNPVDGTPGAGFSGYCAMPTATRTSTSTRTPTRTATPTWVLTPYALRGLIVNEVAWAGTAASGSDEWIELWNPGADPVPLSGWTLTDGGDIRIALRGTIAAGGFFLLEHGEDAIVDILADQLYSGTLSNSGERLQLLDPSGGVVDEAGSAGAGWPAGSSSPLYASLERAAAEPAVWGSNTGWVITGRDAEGNPLRGTPGRPNSVLFPVPTPTPLPKGVFINEFLPKPGSDWNGDRQVDVFDEYIELYNAGNADVDLGGWMLDDKPDGGSRPYRFPESVILKPRNFMVLFRSITKISLGDTEDAVWLLAPDGRRVDGIFYTRTRWRDSAWGRFPDGFGTIKLGFPPTPGSANRLPPDLLPKPPEPPAPAETGWRELDCAARDSEPVLVGAGFLTTGSEEASRAAEGFGWMSSEGGECYAWTAPGGPAGSRLHAQPASPFWYTAPFGFGWWWAPIAPR